MSRLAHTHHIGESGWTNTKRPMTIVGYRNARDITVQFEDGNTVRADYANFCRGAVKNPCEASVYRRGCFGIGPYRGREKNGGHTKHYGTWSGMLERCYNASYHAKRPSYIGCTVCDDWLNFQKFAAWYDLNYYEVSGERMCIDKDILVKGNKTYRPDRCVFVPERINTLFLKSGSIRGASPIGVTLQGRTGKYEAGCQQAGANKHIGSFGDPVSAFLAYKAAKEATIKQVAEEYKDWIPEALFDAMMRYAVEMTD